MARVVHRLEIAGPSGAVFRVTDGASRCVATGMHRLDLQLPQGIYSVSASMGRSMETREVLLNEPQAIELQSSRRSFGDQAFALAPAVLAAIGPHVFRPGGQLIALRGPWRDEEAAADRIQLDRDGVAVPALRVGFVPDPNGCGVWSWQLFELTPEAGAAFTGAPGVLRVTRSVCDPASGTLRGAPAPESALLLAPPTPSSPATTAPDAAQPVPPPNVSHTLPHWGDWMVWAVYPATTCGAPEGLELPHPYYLRLRLTLPGAAPPAALQSLHDQVFTALGARTGLPLSKPVLDLLLLPDDADPLLAVAAAHLASITLAALGKQNALPHDASASMSASGSPTHGAPTELQLIDADALERRFHAWLEHHGDGLFAASPDMVAARFMFGIPTPAHLRVPPTLLRSLDALISAIESPEARASGTRCDESVWGARMQISDAFAFLQWNPDIDYAQELLSTVRRSLATVQASVQFIDEAKAQAELQRAAERALLKAASRPQKAARRAPALRGAPRSAAPQLPQLPAESLWSSAQPSVSALDVEAFIKSNVASLRIPASAMTHFSTVLNSLSIDQDAIAQTLQQLAGRLKE